ncbi:MAG: hypothetical protein ABW185_07830 [Sedimenticola sp.]
MATSAVAGSDPSGIQMGDRLVMTVLSKRSRFDILQEPVCGGALVGRPVVDRPDACAELASYGIINRLTF